MPPTLLLFEFEGVLADTVPLRRAALRHGLADERIALSDADWEAHCHGRPTAEGVERLVRARNLPLDATAQELVALRADRLFAERASRGVSLQPGAYALLSALAGRARLALVTRAMRRTVDFVLGLAGLEAAFEVIVTAEDVRAPKPAPAGYELALERLARRGPVVRGDAERASVDRGAVLALEDSLPGIEAAIAAGLRCVAVGPLPAWQRLGAHAALDGLTGVTPAVLDRLATEPTETSG